MYICVYARGYLFVCVCVCLYVYVYVYVCMCVCVHICVHLHRYIQILYVFIYLYIYVCAKYSDFLCIWLRKCDFLTEKLGIGRIRIRNDLFRIRIRILQKDPDPQHCAGIQLTNKKDETVFNWRFKTFLYIILNLNMNQSKSESVLKIGTYALKNVICSKATKMSSYDQYPNPDP